MSIFTPFKLFPIFSCFIVFILWFNFARTRSISRDRKKEQEFWDKEAKANTTPIKDISTLNYINIPLSSFPFGITSDETIENYEKKIKSLSGKQIVNFTGISNTDLKLKYGTANITSLTEYDTNFTQFVSTLHKWAQKLYALGFVSEALILLECAVQNGSDIKGSYVLLCTIYDELGFPQKKESLLSYAESLNSLMKEPIINFLNESK